MSLRISSTSLLFTCLIFTGCLSPNESALYLERAAREEIRRVQLERKSAPELVPMEERLSRRVGLLDGVQTCACTLYPVEREEETRHEDGSITYRRIREVRILVVVALDAEDRWNADQALNKVSRQIRDAGLPEFTLQSPTRVLETWVLVGCSQDALTPDKAPVATRPGTLHAAPL